MELMATRCEKSEGELTDSEEEKIFKPPSPKKVKNAPSNTERNRKKKQRRMRKKKDQTKPANVVDVTIASVLSSQYLDSNQVTILSKLANLHHLTCSTTTNSPPSPSSSSSSEVVNPPQSTISILKTARLQGVLFHLMLGVPNLREEVSGVEELRSYRVAMIWLSMVSAKLFHSSPDLFTGLKSLTPCLQFHLEHPGSTRFAKLGLESFLSMDHASKKVRRRGGDESLTRTECLLNIDDMNRNDFPLPLHLQKTSSHNVDGFLELCNEWPTTDSTANDLPMFAIDCEMVETKDGFELASVSIIDETMKCLYDTVVKPDNPVLDYKTRFSGITEEILRNVSTTLDDVHRDLTSLLPPHCILIGHSLENDLLALKMIHPFVIDTSCLFPYSVNYTHKPKLQFLAKKFLGVDIQVSDDGHSSLQDASACMEIVLKKLRCGDKMSLVCKGKSILTEIASQNVTVATVDRPGIVNLFGHKTNKYRLTRDEDIVDGAGEIIAGHKLTFLQLHSYEDYIKGCSGRSEDKTERVLRQLDAETMDIVNSCTSGTLVMIICGSSDIRMVKDLQRDMKQLMEVVSVARTGLAIAYIVR